MRSTNITTRPTEDEDHPAPPFQWWSQGLLWHLFGTGAGGVYLGAMLGGVVAAITGLPISLCFAVGMLVGGVTGMSLFTFRQLRANIGQGQRLTDEPLPFVTSSAGSNTHIQLARDQVVTALPRRVYRFAAHDGVVTSLAVSPDNTMLLTGGADTTVKLWDLASGFEVRELGSFAAGVRSIAFSPDGRLAAAGGLARSEVSPDCTSVVLVWEVESGRELRRFDATGLILALAFSPDGERLFFTGTDYLRVWDLESSELVALIRLGTMFSGDVVQSLTISPDERLALCGCQMTQQAWLIDLQRGECLRRFDGHGTGILCLRIATVTGVAFSPEGRRVLTGSLDQTARIWDIDTGKQLMRFRGHCGWGWRGVVAVAFLPDGQRALSASEDGTVRLWDTADGTELARYDHGSRVRSMAVSRNGRQVISGGKDGVVRIWDVPALSSSATPSRN